MEVYKLRQTNREEPSLLAVFHLNQALFGSLWGESWLYCCLGDCMANCMSLIERLSAIQPHSLSSVEIQMPASTIHQGRTIQMTAKVPFFNSHLVYPCLNMELFSSPFKKKPAGGGVTLFFPPAFFLS